MNGREGVAIPVTLADGDFEGQLKPNLSDSSGELHQSTTLWILARMPGVPTGMTAFLARTRASNIMAHLIQKNRPLW
jgi:hypothetical protein